MFELEFVIMLVVVLTEAVKQALRGRFGDLNPAVPIMTALVLGALLNYGNVLWFSPEVTTMALREGIRDGLMAAAAAMGLWSGGKAYITSRQ